MSEAQLAHRRLVQSLYKRSLKTAQDWYLDTNLFRRKAVELRMEFDAKKNLTNPRQIAQAIQETERKLIEFRHPDPYIGNTTTRPYTGNRDNFTTLQPPDNNQLNEIHPQYFRKES